MDLVNGVKTVSVVTDHITKNGQPKLVESCSLPLTSLACVNRVYTSLAVIDIIDGTFVLKEKLPEISVEELQSVTGAKLHITDEVKDLVVPEGL